MDWTLRVGQVRTSDDQVLVIHDEPNFFAIEIDLDTKYAIPFFDSCGKDEAAFTIHIGERTLHYDPDTSRGFTTLRVNRPGDDMMQWSLIQEVGRYTWRIVGYKRYTEDDS